MSSSVDNQTPGVASGEAGADKKLLCCGDFRELLAAYMMRELGDVQSRVLREHLRNCKECRREAAEFRSMLETLQSDHRGTEASEGRLTQERRSRIMRAVFHPVLDWMYCHHRMVSSFCAVLILVIVLYLLRQVALFRVEPLEEGIPVWRMFRSGRLPVLVEKAMQDHQDRRTEDRADDGDDI